MAKKDFTDVVKLRIFRCGDYFDLLLDSHVITRILGRRRERVRGRDVDAEAEI